MLTRDICDICGSETFSEGHFAVGKLWCRECWSGRKPAIANPPTPAYRAQIDLWCAPRTSTPPKAQAPRPGELARPRATLSGTSANPARIGA
jgi:hypothetical protein